MNIRGVIRTGAALLAALLAILVIYVTSSLLYSFLPAVHSAFGVFRIYSEVVGIDVYGAVFPLLLSVVLAATVGNSRKVFPDGNPYDRFFWLLVGGVALGTVVIFQLVQASTGSPALPPVGARLFTVLGGLIGVVYSLRIKKVNSLVRFSVLYPLGCLGIFLSDVIRTLSGLVRAPGESIVWGGAGTHDLVLWFGFYMAVSGIVFSVLAPRIARILSESENEATRRPETATGIQALRMVSD